MTVKDDYKRACVALAICHQMLNDANDKVEALKSENERVRVGIDEALILLKSVSERAEQLEESAEEKLFQAIDKMEALGR